MRSSKPGVKRCYRGASSGQLALDNSDIRHMAAGIVTQAVEDWIYCIRLEAMQADGTDPDRVKSYRNTRVGASNYIEIRRFFQGDYGEMLCNLIDLDPYAVLDKLELWRREFREQGKIPKYAWNIM